MRCVDACRICAVRAPAAPVCVVSATLCAYAGLRALFMHNGWPVRAGGGYGQQQGSWLPRSLIEAGRIIEEHVKPSPCSPRHACIPPFWCKPPPPAPPPPPHLLAPPACTTCMFCRRRACQGACTSLSVTPSVRFPGACPARRTRALTCSIAAKCLGITSEPQATLSIS